jgi:uncharacterized membrane protein
MTEWESALERWRDAELIDAATDARIRAFESSRVPEVPPQRSMGLRWPAIVALAFGGLMLGAGVLLFVAAHWDNLSPGERFAMVVSMVAIFHGAGAYAASRSNQSFETVMHGLGTASLGAAIFLTGQIFNLESHWPLGVLLWAAGAWFAWALRRDWVQLGLAALLTPFWLCGEWVELIPTQSEGRHYYRVLLEGLLLLAICYLAARTRDRSDASRRVLVWIGAIGILPLTLLLAVAHEIWSIPRYYDLDRRAAFGYTVAFALPLALSLWLRGREMWPNVIAAVWVFLLGLIATTHNAGVYAWCGVGAAGLVAWGIRDARSERINIGMIGFAITLLFFYFSEVMDKLGRSASLIGLGVLFLAGGWGLERMRRRFVARVRSTA